MSTTLDTPPAFTNTVAGVVYEWDLVSGVTELQADNVYLIDQVGLNEGRRNRPLRFFICRQVTTPDVLFEIHKYWLDEKGVALLPVNLRHRDNYFLHVEALLPRPYYVGCKAFSLALKTQDFDPPVK